MAETIRGINVVIGAETTGLSKALSDVNKKSRDIQSELRQVDRLLKLDPTNTELLAQKQKLLGDAVQNTSDKLNRLKSVQEQVNRQFERGEISEGQYRAFQREVVKTEQELAKLESQLQDTAPDFKKLGDEAEKASDRIKRAGESVKNVGEKLSVGVTAPIAGVAAAATAASNELSRDLARLATNAEQAGVSMGIVDEAMREVYAITGEVDSSIEGLSNLMASGFDDDKLTPAMEALAGAAIKFSDTLKFEGLADGLQETLATGEAIGPFAELLERSGVALDGFNTGLQEAIANGTQQNYVLEQLAQLGLTETYQAYQENNAAMIENAKASYDLQTSLSQLGEAIAPLLTALAEMATQALAVFTSFDEGTQKTILVIAGLAAALGPVLVILGQVISAVSSFGPVLSALTGPVGIVVAAIAGLVAGLIYLYNTNEDVRNALNVAWEWLKDAAQTIFEAIKEFWAEWGDEILTFFQQTWEILKSVFETEFGIISEIVIFIFGEIKQFWDKWGSTITEAFQNLFEILTISFETTFNSIKNVIETAFNAIREFWDRWGATIITLFKGIWNNTKIVIETAVGVISNIIKLFLSALKGDWQGAWEAVKGIAESIWYGIQNMFANVYETMTSIGKDIVQGMIDGIKSMASKAIDTAKDLASKVANSVKGFFKISSPSRLMMEYGGYIGEGLAIGIKNSVAEVQRQAARLSEAVSSSTTQTTSVDIPVGSVSSSSRPGTIIQNVTIQSPTPLSPSETARQLQRTSRQLAMEWGLS